MGRRAVLLIAISMMGFHLFAGPSDDLLRAAKRGSVSSVKTALKAGAAVNVAGNAGYTALHMAAEDGFIDVVKVLVEAKADVNRMNAQGMTAAECALVRYRVAIVDYLLKNGADIGAIRRRLSTPEDGSLLLHSACVMGLPEAVQGFISFGADVDQLDGFSRTALLQAVTGYCSADAKKRPVFLGIVSTLLDRHANPDKADSKGLTPLSIALRGGATDVADRLLPVVKVVSAQDGILAIRGKYDRLFPELLARIPDIDARDADGMTMLHHAAAVGNLSALELLVNQGASITLRDRWNRPVLELAADGGDAQTVVRLLDLGADINAPGERGLEDTALNVAVRKRNFPLVELLARRGADMNAGQRLNPIQNAVVANDLEMARLLIEHGVDPDGRTDGDMTALLYVPGRAGLEMAEMLVRAGGDIDAVMVSGDSVLDRARLVNDEALAAWLVSRGARSAKEASMQAAQAAPVAASTATSPGGQAAKKAVPGIPSPEELLKAVWANDVRTVSTLLGRNAVPDGLTDAGRTALFYAARQGSLDISRLLVAAGATIDLPDPQGITPLAAACETENLELVEFLVEGGASLEARDFAGRSPLFYACEQGRLDIVSYLLARGADADACDGTGKAVIVVARELGRADVARLLLEAGAADLQPAPKPQRKGR